MFIWRGQSQQAANRADDVMRVAAGLMLWQQQGGRQLIAAELSGGRRGARGIAVARDADRPAGEQQTADTRDSGVRCTAGQDRTGQDRTGQDRTEGDCRAENTMLHGTAASTQDRTALTCEGGGG